MKTPMIVAFEGIDGSGKSTTMREVSKRLTAKDIDHVCVSETRYDEIAETIFWPIRNRQDTLDPVAAQLLVHALRRHVDETAIKPALAKGKLVLMDRYHLSTLVYQADAQLTRTLQTIAVPEQRRVMSLLFDLPAKVAMQRMRGRSEQMDAYDRQDEIEHERRRQSYLNLVLTQPNVSGYTQVLNACQPTDVLAQQVMDVLTVMLSRGAAE